jgi:hypothetical protein
MTSLRFCYSGFSLGLVVSSCFGALALFLRVAP